MAAIAERKSPDKLPMQLRYMSIRGAALDKEKRTVDLSFSSEEPVERQSWYGSYREILDHRKKSVRMERLKNGAPLLRNHDPNQIIGVVDSASLSDSRGQATVRFASSEDGADAMGLVSEDILRNVSVGYIVHRYQITEGKDKEPDEYRAIDWEPVEISLVAVPADPSVGVGRDLSVKEYPVVIERSNSSQQEKKSMATAAIVPEVEVVNNAREGETRRVRNIAALCAKYRDTIKPEQEAKWLGEGTDEATVRMAIADAVTARFQPISGSPAEIVEISEREKKQYSIVRAALSTVDKTNCLEREISSEIEKKLGRSPSHGGLLVPLSLPTQVRAPLTSSPNPAGGFTVATEVQPLIDILRNKLVVRRMGARVLTGLQGNLLFPKQITPGAAVWMAENSGADVTETDVTFGSFTMSPKNVMAMQSYSRQLLAQSTVDVEALVRNDIMAVVALAIDFAALNGPGTANQPLGILGQAGLDVVALGANGAQPSFANILQQETDVATANADVGSLGYVTTPGIRGRLKQTPVLANTIGMPVWTQDRSLDGGLQQGQMNGYVAMASNQVPSNLVKGSSSNCHAIIFGNWDSVLIGEWGAMEITVDPYTKLGQGMVRVVAYALYDTNLRYVQSFSVVKDALP